MGICGAIFAYYLESLRWNRSANLERANARSAKFGFGAAAAVAACFVTGMALAGAPSTQRHREADRTRINDLRNLASAVKRWHDETPSGGLPAGLADLKRPLPRLTDPETNAPYEYLPRAGSNCHGTVRRLCSGRSVRRRACLGRFEFLVAHAGEGVLHSRRVKGSSILSLWLY